MKRILLIAIACFLAMSFSGFTLAQIEGTKQKKSQTSPLKESFSKYELFSINTVQIHQKTLNKSENIQFSLKLGKDYNWGFLLEESNLRSQGSKLTVKTAKGVSHIPTGKNSTFKGFLNNKVENKVRLSIREDEILGMVKSDGEIYFIEPASKFDKNLSKDIHVIYNANDVIEDKHSLCGVSEDRYKSLKKNERGLKNTDVKSNRDPCKLAEIAIAADGSMTVKHGSIANVEQHLLDIMNVVQDRYFHPDINIAYLITEMFIVDDPSNDPNWALGSNDFGAFLDDFTAWGPTGFSAVHDVASLWTDRAFNGTAVGLAWVSTICSNFRYNVLQDFTTNMTQLIQLQAHELGHNWSAGHTASANNTYVMSPSIGALNDQWIAQSITDIVNHKNSRACLDNDCSVFDWDAELTSVVQPDGELCEDTFDPIVILRNAGNETLTSVDIEYDINGGAPLTFSWTGSLTTNSTEQVTLPTMTAPGGTNTFNATTVSGTLNGTNTDEDLANDNASSTFDVVANGTPVTLTIVTDDYGYETAWQILDGGTIEYEGGNIEIIPGGQQLQQDNDGDAYASNVTITENFCIAEGCYDFVIHDDWGDGICCAFGNGSYLLEDDATGTTLASGGEFGASESTAFCVPISTIQVTNTPADITVSCEDSTDPVNTDEMTATTSCGSGGLVINYTDDITAGTCANEYVITRTWVATDNCGSEETHIQTITVVDNTNPTGTAPADVVVQCATDVPAVDPTLITDEADNCTANPTVTHLGDVSDGLTCPETITRTYRIQDECGNFTDVAQTITIDDNIAPTGTAPGDLTVECAGDVPAADPLLITDEADNCSTPTVTHVGDVSSGTTCPINITRTYRIEDDCGNFIEVDQIITVNDNTTPTGTAPADLAVQCIGDVPTADPLLITDETDNCAVPTVSHVSDVSDGLTCPETITRTYRIEDDCGNFIDVTQTITVNDDVAPTGTAPADVSVQCIGDVPAANPASITDEADNCNVPMVTHVSDVSDGLSCPETITRTYRIQDDCGNFIDVTQTITVNDDTAPTGTAPANVAVQCIGDVPAADPLLITDEADNCTATPTVTHVGDVSDGLTCPETITRTYRIQDDCGNFTDLTQTITVDDNIAPTGTAPSNVAVQCIGDVPTADPLLITDEADNCTANPTVTHVGDVSDGLTCPEIITRTYRIQDDCGNFTDVTQTITVNDDILPTGTAPADVTVECSTDVPTADPLLITDEADNCTVAPVVAHVSDVSNGSVCNGEVITRTYSITDDCGNFIEVQQSITIDASTPVFAVTGTDPTTCGDADGFITISGLGPNTDYTFEYDSNAAMTITTDGAGEYVITGLGAGSYTGFTVSDVDCGSCSTTDGSTITLSDPNAPAVNAGVDQQVCEGSSVTLTATNPDGATISWNNGVTDGVAFTPGVGTVTYTVTADLAGCINTDQVDVTVIPQPVLDPLPNQVECDSYILPAITGTNLTGNEAYYTGTGGSGTQLFSGDVITATGTTTLYIYDETGTTPNCFDEVTFDVTVTPAIDALTCPGGLTAVCNITEQPAYANFDAFITAGGSATIDPAGEIDSTSFALVSQVSDGNSCPETVTRTYVISDICGATATCTQTITIDDNINPTGTAPVDVAVQCIDDVPAADPTLISDEADNCTVPTVTHVGDVSDGLTCPETITRTYRIEDACGNFIEVDQIITVDDTTDPDLNCDMSNDTVYSSESTTLNDYTATASASDNCTQNVSISQTPSPGTDLVLGNNEVVISATDDCGNESTCTIDVFYEDDASLVENELSSVNFYPNPTTNILNIDFGLVVKDATIILYDANGKLVVEKKTQNKESETIDLSSFAKGMYTVVVHSSNSSSTQKVSKM